ncbi:MAG: hypothetical protein WKF77_08630 [Planctomycetaceae bacterium]
MERRLATSAFTHVRKNIPDTSSGHRLQLYMEEFLKAGVDVVVGDEEEVSNTMALTQT